MEKTGVVDLKIEDQMGQKGWEQEIEIMRTYHEGVGGQGRWIAVGRKGKRNVGGGVTKNVNMGQAVDYYT